MNDDDERDYPVYHPNCLCTILNSMLDDIMREVGEAIVRDAKGVADLTSLYEARGLSKGN